MEGMMQYEDLTRWEQRPELNSGDYSDQWREGCFMANEGRPVDCNPYEEESPEYEAWEAGWQAENSYQEAE